jgi:hypothetical protein
MKQKDFVKQAIMAAIAAGLSAEALNSAAAETIKNGLISGECEHSKGPMDEKAAKSYAKSLVGNYLKKDKDLNGGVKYEPTTRRGPIVKDQRLKDLKTSLKALEANSASPELIAQVTTAIATREAELEAEKTTSKLPSLEETMAKLAELGINVA